MVERAKLPRDDDQILRRRPELIRVLDLEIPAEAGAIALWSVGFVQALTRHDLIPSGRIRHLDLPHRPGIDRSEEITVERPRGNQRPAHARNQGVRAAFLDDDALLYENVLISDDVISLALGR